MSETRPTSERRVNAMEAIARELVRVSTIRARYEHLRMSPHVIVEPQIAMMTDALERACLAAGSGDPVAILQSLNELKSYED